MEKRIIVMFLIFAGAIALLACPGADGGSRGSVTAGMTESRPVIDGVLDDECWEKTVEVNPFMLMASISHAGQQTRAYVCYDSENLYAAFRCEEFALDPVNNILHEFVMEVEEDNDAGIFRDDVVVLLLDPGDGMVYDIFVNARGTVNSAAGERADSWGTRDTSWGEGIEVAGRVDDDGYWTAEIKVPFEVIGTRPGRGDSWGICFGRIQQREHERSSWPPLHAGFHMPDYFGQVVFGSEVPRVRISRLWEYSRGENEMELEIDPSGRRIPVRLESEIEYPGERRLVEHSSKTLSEPGIIRHAYTLPRDGDVEFRYSVTNRATLESFYQSPAYRSRVISTELVLLEEEGAPVVYLNGKELDNGAPLYSGVNVLAVKAPGRVRAEFGVGDFRFSTGGGWRYSRSAPEGWKDAEYSDAGWEKVRADDEDMIGAEGEEGYYRRTVLFNHSTLWPNWEMEGLWVAEDSIQQLLLFPQGVEGYRINDYSFYLEVPGEFKVAGASSYYNHLPSLEAREEGSILRGGKQYTRYLIHTTDTVVPRDIPSHNLVSVALELPASGKEFEERDAGVFYYYLEAEEGSIMELPQSLDVYALPPLRGKQPQTYIWQLWVSWLTRMNDKVLMEKIYNNFQKAGFNEAHLPEPYLEGTNLGYLVLIDFNSWNIDMRPYLAENPLHARLDKDGQRIHFPGDGRRNHVCTTLLLNDTPARSFMEEALEELVRERRPDHVNWDYESNVWTSYLSCYDERCMDEFRDFGGISAGANLDPDVIRAEYHPEWQGFMHKRMAELAGIFREASRKAIPDVTFSVYSGYQSERTKEIYGVDWSLLPGKIDVAMCGYGRPLREIRDTLEAVGEVPLVLGAIVTPYRHLERQYPNYISRARLLRRAVDGTGGVLFYMLSSFDGKTFYASAEISRLVAEYEDIFVESRRADDLVRVSGISSADAAVLTDGSTRIVMLFNESDTARRAAVRNLDLRRGMRVLDYYGEEDLGRREMLETEIPPNDVRVYIIK